MKSRVCSVLLKTLTIDMEKYYAYPLPAFVTNQLTLKSQFVFTLATMFLSLLIFAAPRFSSFYPMPLLQLNQNLRQLRKWVLHQTAFRPESSEIRQWTGSGDCQPCNIGTQEIGLDLSWLCGSSDKHWHKTETRLIPDNRDKMFERLPVVGINQGLRCFLYTRWAWESDLCQHP